MHVNPTPPPPPTLRDRVSAILSVLGLAPDDVDLRQRVTTFVICNGYQGVARAARWTAAQQGREKEVAEPWPYTVRVYNRTLARLSYLYTLTHWAESGLRSQLDLHYSDTLGATWRRDPRQYLDGRSVNGFVQETRTLLPWEPIPGAPAMRVADTLTPPVFLERVSFAWLAQMILTVHRRDARRILVGGDGRPVDYLRVQALLKDAVGLRNAVAHNRFLSNNVYTKGEADLHALLILLRFDVAKALQRIEVERRALVTGATRHLGGTP